MRKEYGANAIGPFIEEISERNSNLSVSNVLGISKEGFISPNQRPGDLDKYYIFKKDNFVYSPPRINVGSIGLYEDDKPAVCSPIYVVFKVKDKTVLNPKYLMMWLRRSEFLRSTDFYSIASVRNNFSYELMEQVKIAIPSIDVQNSIVKVFERRSTCEKNIGMLRKKLFELCPILIKGSIIEAKGGN